MGLLVLAGCALAWHKWTQTPEYALRQIAKAVKERDRYLFDEYVDIDNLVQSAMLEATQDAPLATAIGTAIGGAVGGSLKQQVFIAIEEGLVPDAPTPKAIHQALATGGPPTVERVGRNAYFTVPTTTRGGAPFSLRLHLTRVPEGHWRIDRIANLKELSDVEAQEEKERKAKAAKATEEELAKFAVVAKLHTSIHGDWTRVNRFQVRFENKGEKTVTGMTGRIRLPAKKFDRGIRADCEVAPGASWNGTWEFDVNRFRPETERVFALGETEDFIVTVDSLSYSDGTVVQRADDP